jgi:hypothetical protein
MSAPGSTNYQARRVRISRRKAAAYRIAAGVVFVGTMVGIHIWLRLAWG